MIKTALISVFNKEGIAEFAKHLSGLGTKIISREHSQATGKEWA